MPNKTLFLNTKNDDKHIFLNLLYHSYQVNPFTKSIKNFSNQEFINLNFFNNSILEHAYFK